MKPLYVIELNNNTMTTITVENLKVTVGKIEELEKQMEGPELEDLLWYGITYIVTTLKGVKIFYIARRIREVYL